MKNLSKQAGFAPIILLAVIALIAVGAGAYYLGTQKTSGTPTAESTPTPSATTNETANWKVYKKGKIEFRYPQNWFVEENRSATLMIYLNDKPFEIPTGTDASIGQISIGLDECTNTVTNEKYPCKSSMDEEINTLKDMLTSPSVRDVTINGKLGKQITGVVSPYQPAEGTKINRIYLPYDNIYHLYLDLSDSNQEEVFNKILSTFRFTN